MEEKTYRTYVTEIGNKVKLYRVNKGLSQQDLSDKTGISVRSISRFEQGATIQLDNLVKILVALDLQQNMDLLVPDQTKRPSYYLEKKPVKNRRVRKSEKSDVKFKWGDEQ